jgi:orotate phosphoribosyltransferase
MEKRVVILPFDGYENVDALTKAFNKLMDQPDLASLIAYIKLNDGVHNADAGGPALIDALKYKLVTLGLPVGIFLDLKIADVSATVVNTLKKYALGENDIVTVSSSVSVATLIALRPLIPNVKVAMVSALTDMSREECQSRFGQFPEVKIYNDLINIEKLYSEAIGRYQNWPHKVVRPFNMVVCSPHELTFLKKNLSDHYQFIVPGIRDAWMLSDHQQRTTGVRAALDAGADFVVMGAQLTKGNPKSEISAAQSIEFTKHEIAKARDKFVIPGNLLETLKACDGYYVSPRDKQGKLLGPLVGYAGTYDTEDGPKNYVGYEYFNFAKAEMEPCVLDAFADNIAQWIQEYSQDCNLLIGAPMGGILLAGAIGRHLNCRTIFAEKKVVTLADLVNGKKEESIQIIDRHEINPGDKVIVVEDVCNNFSTTAKLQELIKSRGGKLIGIACAVNRSGQSRWNEIPIRAAITLDAKQYRQTDPEVVDLLEARKIAWRPKFQWPELKKAME